MIFIMARSFKEAIQHRRTHYGIGNNSPISDNEIHEIIKTAVTHVPSAFNSQSTRIVLLLGESHKKLWEIVKDTLRKIVPAEAYKATEAKIDNSFEAGYGTVLFFEDTAVVEGLQKQFPSYKGMVPTDIGYASTRDMDYAGRRRFRRFSATLQPVDRRGGR